MKLVTIPNVPLVSTGTYNLSTGEHTFTEEELAAAVAALGDPAVKAPRVKIDGLGDSFDPDAHGGEPAFGHVENMRLDAKGTTLIGDLKVPAWLADSIEWAYPARSIEGSVGHQTPTGKTHELVITAVALLGVELPGVSTLPDLQELLSQEGPAPEAETVLARAPRSGNRLQAGLDQDLVRRRFYDMVESGEIDLPDGVVGWDLWVRSMRFDDDGKPYLKVEDDGSGRLYRVDFTVSDSDVTFGDFVEVVEQDVAVAAATEAMRRPPLAIYASRAESRAIVQATNRQEAGMNPEHIRRLRERAGLTEADLPDDATDEQINSALDRVGPSAETQPNGDDNGSGSEPNTEEGAGADTGNRPADAGGGEGNPAETEPQPSGVAAAAAQLPAGMVVVDEATLRQLRQGAEPAQQLAARQAREDRDRVLAQAMQEGRFPPARRGHYESMWQADPEGTRTLLTAAADKGGLAPGTVPVSEAGTAPQEHDAGEGDIGYDPSWLPPQQRALVAAAHGETPTASGGARIIREV
jgi:hypothetical protein